MPRMCEWDGKKKSLHSQQTVSQHNGNNKNNNFYALSTVDDPDHWICVDLFNKAAAKHSRRKKKKKKKNAKYKYK